MDEEANELLKSLVTEPAQRPSKLPSFISSHTPVAQTADNAPPSVLKSNLLYETLCSTRTWLVSLAILSFFFWALFFLIVLILGPQKFGMGPIQVVVALIVTLIGLIPPIFMTTYANRIQDFCRCQERDEFLQVLSAQRSMWKLLGVYSLVGTVLVAVVIFFQLL